MTSNLSKAHEMRNSLSSSYLQVGFIHFGAIHSWNLNHSHKLQKNTKTDILEVQGHSRSSMFTPIKSLSLLLVMMSSMSLPICNSFQATREKYPLSRGGLATLTPACAGLLELRGSGLGLLKSTFNAKNFLCRLSWSISSHFVAIQC